MLQNIRDRLTGPFTWFVVALIVIPFAFFGIETFRTGGGDPTVARIGGYFTGQKITQSQFRQQYDQRLQQLQALMGENFRQEQFNQEQFRQAVLDDMVQELVLRRQAQQSGYVAGDAALFEALKDVPAFQADGKFSSEAYRAYVSRRGTTPARFEAQMRDALLIDQMRGGVLESGFATDRAAGANFRLEQQQRGLSYAVFEAGRFLSQAQVDAAQVQARYDEQKSRYQAPERLKVAYVELALDALAPAEKPNADVLRVIYEADKGTRFSTPEERRARHLLIRFGSDKDAAKQRAAKLAERVRAGGDFTALAGAESEDPGSNKKGGDLGWVRRGQMLAKFEEALFALNKGDVSDPVETEFGWHVIRVEDVREPRTSDFDDPGVQSELLKIYRQRDAERRFQELSEKLEQVAFESPTSLEPAAKATGVPVQVSDWFTRAGGSGIAAKPAAVEAAFSEDVLQAGENSRVVNLGDNRVAVMRKQEYEPPRQRALEEVSGEIRDELRNEQARAKAAAAAAAVVAAVQSGRSLESAAREQGASPKAAGLIRRRGSDVDPAIVEALFRLPRPAGDQVLATQVTLKNGDVAAVALTAVQDGDWAQAEADRAREVGRYREVLAGAEFAAYRADVQKRVPVKIVNPPEGEPAR